MQTARLLGQARSAVTKLTSSNMTAGCALGSMPALQPAHWAASSRLPGNLRPCSQTHLLASVGRQQAPTRGQRLQAAAQHLAHLHSQRLPRLSACAARAVHHSPCRSWSAAGAVQPVQLHAGAARPPGQPARRLAWQRWLSGRAEAVHACHRPVTATAARAADLPASPAEPAAAASYSSQPAATQGVAQLARPDDDAAACDVSAGPTGRGSQLGSHEEPPASRGKLQGKDHGSSIVNLTADSSARMAGAPPAQHANAASATSAAGQGSSGAGREADEQTATRGPIGRMRVAVRDSLLLFYTSYFYNSVIRLLQALGVARALQRLAPRLERVIARVTGAWHELPSGERIPYSLINDMDPDFSIPPLYNTQDFPFDGQPLTPCQLMLRRSHLLVQASRLIYENEAVMADLARRWDFEYLGTFEPPEAVRSRPSFPEHQFVPHSRACLLGNAHALVVSFRGTDPINLVNWFTNAAINMVTPEGMGRVHKGFYDALFSEWAAEECLFEKVVQAIQENSDCEAPRPIFITGHSAGGALATLFALALVAREPKVARRVAGVYPIAAPRVGDQQFCDTYGSHLGAITARYVHGSDIVPKLPPRWLDYRHFDSEFFIDSFGRLHDDPKEIAKWHSREAWGFLPFYLYKIGAGAVVYHEPPLRLLYRVVFLVVAAGFTDHVPCDYERKIRRLLEKYG